MKFHLYQRTISIKGKPVKAWYYWYYDNSGKQVRKSCGQNKQPCLLKRDAQSYIEQLEQSEAEEEKRKNSITLREFADHLYDVDSVYLKIKANKGKEIVEQTRYMKDLYLHKFLAEFGNYKPDEVTSDMIDNWLISLPNSNSNKNQIMLVIDEVYEELYRKKLITYRPLLERFKRNDKKKGTLLPAEIKKLFPDDYEELIKVWHVKQCTELQDYTFATLIFTIISTGMRSCEVRALQFNQFVQQDAILLNCMIDSSDERVNHLKKGNEDHKKWRVAILPSRAVVMINNMVQMGGKTTDYVFEYKGERFTTHYLLNHFKKVMRNNNIDHESRNITVHSLRFTYNTIVKPEIDGKDLRLMMGHVTEEMTEYYDRSEALQHLPELIQNKNKLDQLFS